MPNTGTKSAPPTAEPTRPKKRYVPNPRPLSLSVATPPIKEYRAIVAAGILLQVDDPFLPDIFVEPGLDDKQKKRRAEIYVEATNEALNGIPAERVRFHTCYGINEGTPYPRIEPAGGH